MRHVNQTRDVKDDFLVFDPEDRLFNSCLCHGEEEAREVVAQFGSTTGLRVRRITEGDFARDVTSDFISDDSTDEWAGTSYDRAASAADRSYRERMEGIR